MNIEEVLQLAAGNFNIVKEFINQGRVDINSTDSQGKNFLHRAVDDESPSSVAYFLSLNVNAELCDARGRTPLYYAFKFEEYFVTRSFLDHYLKRAKGQLQLYFQMLNKMVLGRNISLEIDKAEDLDFKQLAFESPLRIAVILENQNYVRKLIEAGAERRVIKNPREISIMEEAFIVGEDEILETIFELAPMDLHEIQLAQKNFKLDAESFEQLKKFEQEIRYVESTYVGAYKLSKFLKRKRVVRSRMINKKNYHSTH